MDSTRRHRNLNWIEADSGNTYLCPPTVRNVDSLSEAEIRELCLDESRNPQNN